MSADQHLFTNMLRSMFNIDGYLLPELTAEHQGQFVRDPVRYYINTDKAQQDAIYREVIKRQTGYSDPWRELALEAIQSVESAVRETNWGTPTFGPDAGEDLRAKYDVMLAARVQP